MTPKKIDVYKLVTDEILKRLEAGVVPWKRPWVGGPPANYLSRKPYRGINAFLLAITAELEGYQSPYWLTFKQALDCKASVRKGEKSTLVCFWKKFARGDDEEEDEDGKKSFFMLKYFRVFNVQQCDGLIIEGPQKPPDPIAECDAIADTYAKAAGPVMETGRARCCYAPKTDTVTMPDRAAFHSAPALYCSLFHELGHSTGHPKRLKRFTLEDGDHNREEEPYAKEELVAEMCAAFLCGHTGIEQPILDNAASYIHGWMQAIKDDGKLIVSAAAKAQRAADLILGVTPEQI